MRKFFLLFISLLSCIGFLSGCQEAILCSLDATTFLSYDEFIEYVGENKECQALILETSADLFETQQNDDKLTLYLPDADLINEELHTELNCISLPDNAIMFSFRPLTEAEATDTDEISADSKPDVSKEKWYKNENSDEEYSEESGDGMFAFIWKLKAEGSDTIDHKLATEKAYSLEKYPGYYYEPVFYNDEEIVNEYIIFWLEDGYQMEAHIKPSDMNTFWEMKESWLIKTEVALE